MAYPHPVLCLLAIAASGAASSDGGGCLIDELAFLQTGRSVRKPNRSAPIPPLRESKEPAPGPGRARAPCGGASARAPARPRKAPLAPGMLELGPARGRQPVSAGCVEQPEWAKHASADTPAEDFNVDGWNGFCQISWTLCADARAIGDYGHYARGLVEFPGFGEEEDAVIADTKYCGLNGFLEPEIRAIADNFAALQAKGEELCSTKFDTPYQHSVTLDMNGNGTAPGETEAEYYAHVAAWNCAMGDLSCDLAYCSTAFCKQEDGSFGAMGACEGWDGA